MSVETPVHQSHAANESFRLSPVEGEDESAALNLTQVHRKKERKRKNPQKTVNSDEFGDEEEVSSDDAYSNNQSPSNDDKIMNTISEEARSKAKSILEHYRSFIQRNSPSFSSDKFGLKNPKLMKTDLSGDESWEQQNMKNGEDNTVYESALNGPSNGPNSIIPERTMRQNNWAIKVWRDWALSRNRKPETKLERFSEAPVDIRVADVEVMSYWLPKFIKEVRRKDKKPYPADTLMQIASGLQRYLRQVSCRSEVNFFDKYSNTFAEFREALKERSGELSLEAQANKTGKRIQVDNLSDEELWQSGYLDYTTAKGIFHVVFYYNCVEFEVTSMEEHHELKVEQFQLAIDPTNNTEYIQFKRSDQRYYNMSTKLMMRRYSTPEDPRCLVKLYKAYLDLVPSTGPFYRRPLQTPENSSPRFSFNPVGINKLRETHKQLFSPDRPASLRQSGKTKTIRHASQQSNDLEQPTSPSSTTSVISPSLTTPSQVVYNAITQNLKTNGHLRTADNAVDLSVKSIDDAESNEEPSAVVAPLSVEKVMERIRKTWQNVQQTGLLDVSRESQSDEVLTLKVPNCVKYVVIEREGKKQKFDLNV